MKSQISGITPETEIVTKDKIKMVKDLAVGDLVYTYKARYKPIEKISLKKINESILEIKLKGNRVPIKITKNHKLLVIKTILCPYRRSRKYCFKTCPLKKNTFWKKEKCKEFFKYYHPEWVNAKDLNKYDFLVYPFSKKEKNKTSIKINDYIKKKSKNGFFKVKTNKEGIGFLKNTIKLNADFLRLCGYFLADGHASKNRIFFSFGKNELNFVNDVENIFYNFWKLKSDTQKEKNTIVLRYNRNLLARFFQELFGKIPFGKIIPKFIMELPAKKQIHLIEGYFYGDGCFSENRGFNFISVTPMLIEQIKQILLRNKIITTFYTKIHRNRFGKRKVKKSKIYGLWVSRTDSNNFSKILKWKKPKYKIKMDRLSNRQAFIFKNFLCLKIQRIEERKYFGEVYNCEVKKDNSYTSSGATFHNHVE